MKVLKKKNASLIIGFSLPVGMILFVALSIYLPSLFINPQYNFLYSTGDSSYGSLPYGVRDNHVVKNPEPTSEYQDYNQTTQPQLYVHDVKTNMSTAVSIEQAQKLTLDISTESPDGYKVEAGGESGGFFPFFGYNNDSNEYLVGHNMSKKLKLHTVGTYDTGVHFIGWIK